MPATFKVIWTFTDGSTEYVYTGGPEHEILADFENACSPSGRWDIETIELKRMPW